MTRAATADGLVRTPSTRTSSPLTKLESGIAWRFTFQIVVLGSTVTLYVWPALVVSVRPCEVMLVARPVNRVVPAGIAVVLAVFMPEEVVVEELVAAVEDVVPVVEVGCCGCGALAFVGGTFVQSRRS